MREIHGLGGCIKGYGRILQRTGKVDFIELFPWKYAEGNSSEDLDNHGQVQVWN